MTNINDDSRVVNKLETSLTDDARVVVNVPHVYSTGCSKAFFPNMKKAGFIKPFCFNFGY